MAPSRAFSQTYRVHLVFQDMEEDTDPVPAGDTVGRFLGELSHLCVCSRGKRMGCGEGSSAWQLSREGTNHQFWGLGFCPHFLLPGQAFTHFLC